jgi:hypothetical protein
MVRTQVQLTETQAERLREVAMRRRVSLAALIRRGVDCVLEQEAKPDQDEIDRRFLAFLGTVDLGAPDVAENHDKYLAEAYDHDGDD